jgi:peptidoglycan glycosyltransferase
MRELRVRSIPCSPGRADSQVIEQLRALVTGSTPQGASIMLSLDPEIQQLAWDALGDNKGSVVVMEPQTGRILAMVSKPSYDPNLLAAHSSSAVLESYLELADDSDNPLANRAIAGDLYFPGSVFKTIMMAAALESGDFTCAKRIRKPSRASPAAQHRSREKLWLKALRWR